MIKKYHPIDRDTELSTSILTLRNWKKLGYYKDFLTLGHYICSILDAETYFILNANFGTLSEALLDNHKTILTTDINEDFVWSMSPRIVNTFRTVDVFSPVLKVGKYDVIISIPGTSIITEDKFLSYLNFIDRHCLKYFIVHVKKFYIHKNVWIKQFESLQYEYCNDLTTTFIKDMKQYTKLDLSNLLIFKNIKPPKEWSDAGSSPENGYL